MDMRDLNHSSFQQDLPCCAEHSTNQTVTVISGQWEREFFQCSSCGQAFAAAWRNAYEQRPDETGRSLRELSEAAA
jgi:hypothetical protein